MGIGLNITPELENLLRKAAGDNWERQALEALVFELYRDRAISQGQVRQLLGLETRWDAEAWLAARGGHVNYSMEDLEEDRETIRKLFGKAL